jgi:hypothetical protein
MPKKMNGPQSSAGQSQETNRRRLIDFHTPDSTTKTPARQQPNVHFKFNLTTLLFHVDNEILLAESAGDDDAYYEGLERKRRLLADIGEEAGE